MVGASISVRICGGKNQGRCSMAIIVAQTIFCSYMNYGSILLRNGLDERARGTEGPANA